MLNSDNQYAHLQPWQQNLLDRIHHVLLSDYRIKVASLGGSLGRGEGDEFSDVDIFAFVETGSAPAVAAAIGGRITEITTPVLLKKLQSGLTLNVVTSDWERFDISIIDIDELDRYAHALITRIFDRTGKAQHAPLPPRYCCSQFTLSALVGEFFRVLGLTVVVLARRQYLVAISGIELLRRMTMELMLEENALPPWKRGALHWDRLLMAEQRAQLLNLPAPMPARDSIISATQEIANVFLPRARRLSTQIGMEWPADFERATQRYLETHLGLHVSSMP